MPTGADHPEAGRADPYRSFRFRLKWAGKYVAGFARAGSLDRGARPARHRAGGDPATRRPGRDEFGAVTLQRGLTRDAEFARWANKAWERPQPGTGLSPMEPTVPLADFRMDVTLDLYDEAGRKIMAYNIRKCWPSQFVASPELDSAGDAIAIETLALQNEGWERDPSVAAPDGPGFTPPDGR